VAAPRGHHTDKAINRDRPTLGPNAGRGSRDRFRVRSVLTELAPDVTIGPDFLVGGVAFELFDSNANAGIRTILDVGDALDAALRMVGAAIRLRRLFTP
jgi:hypothetical protein